MRRQGIEVTFTETGSQGIKVKNVSSVKGTEQADVFKLAKDVDLTGLTLSGGSTDTLTFSGDGTNGINIKLSGDDSGISLSGDATATITGFSSVLGSEKNDVFTIGKSAQFTELTLSGGGVEAGGFDTLAFSGDAIKITLNGNASSYTFDVTDGSSGTAKDITTVKGISDKQNEFNVGTSSSLSLTGGNKKDEFDIVTTNRKDSGIFIDTGNDELGDEINVFEVTKSNIFDTVTPTISGLTMSVSNNVLTLNISLKQDDSEPANDVPDRFDFDLTNLGSNDILSFYSGSVENKDLDENNDSKSDNLLASIDLSSLKTAIGEKTGSISDLTIAYDENTSKYSFS